MRQPSIILGILAGLLCQGLMLAPAKSLPRKHKTMVLNAFVRQTTQNPLLEKDPSLEKKQPGVVGLDLVIKNGEFPLVQNVFKGSPADRSGLRTGDILLAVDGVSTLGKSRDEVDLQISDVPGTPVHFDVNRNGVVMQFGLTVVSLASMTQALRQYYAEQPEFPKH